MTPEPRPRGPVDWARQQAAEREKQAAGRPTASTITQPELDALHAELDQARTELSWWAAAESADAAAGSYAGRVEELTATLGRVRKLAAELFVAGATDTHRSIGRQILNALQAPVPGGDGPADEARLDRAHWEAKYSGDRP